MLWHQAKADEFIPDYMQGGLKRWIEYGIAPGGFLCALLKNDLAEACGLADSTNQTNLHNYVTYLYNYAPQGCWGSVENFNEWSQMHVEKLKTNKEA